MSVLYIKKTEDLNKVETGTNLVLGLFDGVHIGHYQLISCAKYMSKGPLSIITFDCSLKTNDNEVLLSLEDKIEYFKKIGVDNIYIFVCNEEFKEISYRKFIEKYLLRFKPLKIFCGPDFSFGFKAQGDVNSLKSYFDNVIVLNYVNDHNGNKLSSSVIKKLIKNGDIYDANRFLGYEYYVKGVVVTGNQIGKKIGYPTVNLKLDANYILPPKGVYISKVSYNNRLYPGMTNIGTHPTIGDNDIITIETHILNFNEDIYDEKIKLIFYTKLRDEVKFNNLDDLVNELNKNKEEVKKYFGIY